VQVYRRSVDEMWGLSYRAQRVSRSMLRRIILPMLSRRFNFRSFAWIPVTPAESSFASVYSQPRCQTEVVVMLDIASTSAVDRQRQRVPDGCLP